MRQEQIWCTCLLAGLATALVVLVAGCPGSGNIGPKLFPPQLTGAAVAATGGTLTQNQVNAVRASASAVDIDGTVKTVTVDLSAIGGPGALPLAFDTASNLWIATTTVTPTVAGSRRATFTAVDNNGLSGTATATIDVVGGGGNGAPLLTNPTATGALNANFVSQVTVSVTVTDTGGTITGVTADLLSVGGLNNQPLTLSATPGGLWSFTALVIPPSSGQKTITFTATDNLGATGTASTTVTVVTPLP